MNSRRSLLTGALALSASAMAPWSKTLAASFTRVIDLTHLLTPGNATGNMPPFKMEPLRSFAKDQMNINIWTIVEHTGTHIDAPLHFSANGPSLDTIPVEDLLVPLALIDVSRRAAGNPGDDVKVMPDDIKAWEAAHGPLPAGCCVAMNSGRGKLFGTPAANARGPDGKAHTPGFHIDTAQFLMRERKVKGLGVDTASLDGSIAGGGFPVHNAWLQSGRWGVENLANLESVPASGATLVVGAMKFQGATGGPARVMALLP